MFVEIPDLAAPDKLIYRVLKNLEKGRKLAFLIGSGMTLRTPEAKGVPGVEEIVGIIKNELSDAEGQRLFDEAMKQCGDGSRYQAAMKLLLECEGQEALNRVITKSVLNALNSNFDPTAIGDNEKLKALEGKYDIWSLNCGVSQLSQIYNSSKFVGPILTSNFDPLISIGIKKLGGAIEVTPISEDGSISRFGDADSTRSIIHFHGYWRGTDTLHTADQITRGRPKLAGELRRILKDTTLLVIGYGGWDDVFTNTLTEIIAEGAMSENILWAFFEKDPALVMSKHRALLEKLRPQIGSRVILYGGIDSNVFFEELNKRLKTPASVTQGPVATPNDRELAFPKPNLFMTKSVLDPGCDLPPSTSYWTGRSEELMALTASSYKVAFITGIGGQGKSCLAAHLLSTLLISTKKVVFWDWRDCKEETNHMHTNLVRICARLSAGSVSAEEIKEEKEDSLIELMFSLIKNEEAYFVFDNVDEYIDLTSLLPSKAIKTIVDEALKRNHRAKFIFTCRPKILLTATGFVHIEMSGFNAQECLNLFSQYKINLKDDALQKLSERACELTNGHPFWINIIAAQGEMDSEMAEAFMNDLEGSEVSGHTSQSESDLLAAQMLATVWKRLSEKSRDLLRSMAEAVCAESEDSLHQVLKKQLSYNAINKSLKKLRQLNLIVVKSKQGSKEYFDLHPLVRRFVRYKFSLEQRRSYIALYILYFDQLIAKLKPGINARSTFSDFSNWSYRIELNVNSGDFTQALISLCEVGPSLRVAGFLEEYIRLTMLILDKVEWGEEIAKSGRYFDVAICDAVEALSHLSRFEDADMLMEKVESLIKGSDISFLRLCNAKSFRYWMGDDFEKAIVFARRAMQLKESSGADIQLPLEHRLALALRDSRLPENVNEALKLFLSGETIEEILKTDPVGSKRYMSFFGNIGRCLQFINQYKNAVVFYLRSLKMASQSADYYVSFNRAYAYLWLGEILEDQGQGFVAGHFYRYAHNVWEKKSPLRAHQASKAFRELTMKEPVLADILKKDEVEIQAFCEGRLNRM